jgi:tRNA (guanine37-N1)-methyltransferase
MTIEVLTLFPEMFGEALGSGVTGRALKGGGASLELHNIRNFSSDRHRKTDDYPFGGGAGMVLMPQPVFSALSELGTEGKRLIYMSPRGRVLNGGIAAELAREEQLLILCGRYEGLDQRVIDYFGFEEISIGDYILTGGELPAMVLLDAVLRLMPGVLGNESAHAEESVYSGLLEYPQYTRPELFEFGGECLAAPPVLLSGNHREIKLWNFRASLELTGARRPELLNAFIRLHDNDAELPEEKRLSKGERSILDEFRARMSEMS